MRRPRLHIKPRTSAAALARSAPPTASAASGALKTSTNSKPGGRPTSRRSPCVRDQTSDRDRSDRSPNKTTQTTRRTWHVPGPTHLSNEKPVSFSLRSGTLRRRRPKITLRPCWQSRSTYLGWTPAAPELWLSNQSTNLWQPCHVYQRTDHQRKTNPYGSNYLFFEDGPGVGARGS